VLYPGHNEHYNPMIYLCGDAIDKPNSAQMAHINYLLMYVV